jgi:hypothetical protein
VLFRPFIIAQLTAWGWRIQAVAWKGETGKVLNDWLHAVDQANDIELFRALYFWKTVGHDLKTWYKDLLTAFRAADGAGERAQALQKYDQSWQLDHATATALYETDPDVTRDFILRHFQPEWGAKRRVWDQLCNLARQRGDDPFYFALYRKLVSTAQWKKDVLKLCDEVTDPHELVTALDQHHPEDWIDNVGEVFYRLVEKRGRDVVPYILKRLRNVWTGGGKGGYFGKMRHLAGVRGWLDLWAALIRHSDQPESYNKAVADVLEDAKLDDEEKFRRLTLVAGPGREWSGSGRRGGWQQIHRLNDKTAVALYTKFPELLQGPFRRHLLLAGWNVTGYTQLVAAARRQDDEPLLDHLAAVTVVRAQVPWHKDKGLIAFTELMTGIYRKLLDTPAEFARRAANVLGQLSAGAIGRNYRRLVQTNALARFLFEETRDVYLHTPEVLRDLLESPVGQVQALALRVLAHEDDRARESASRNLDVLQATLLRPLHRRTRLWAFRALLGAATTLENAQLIHDKARQALDLPDKHYPKDRLIGLLGRLLRRWPELRSGREAPVIYSPPQAVDMRAIP